MNIVPTIITIMSITITVASTATTTLHELSSSVSVVDDGVTVLVLADDDG